MEDLAKAIIRAASIHEESWDIALKRYHISLYDASDQAAELMGFDSQGSQPIYLLLTNCWNEALSWANSYIDNQL